MEKVKIYSVILVVVWLLIIGRVVDIPALLAEKKTFTWIGHDVDVDFADWLGELHFTDVVVRYGTNDAESYSVLEQAGVTFWRWVHGAFGRQGWSVAQYVSALTSEVSKSPSGKIYVDDCDAIFFIYGEQTFSNFLEAVRQVQSGDNIILVFYMSSQTPYKGLYSFGGKIDFSNINLDVYHPPTTNLEPLISVINPKTLGSYLWCWAGSGDYVSLGYSWDRMTQGFVDKKFREAEDYGLARITTWMGHETDAVEKGMFEASLYNYPQWWDSISEANEGFRR